MSNLTSVQKIAAGESPLHLWSLDFPAAGKPPKIAERGLYLQGWVLTQPGVVRGSIIVRVTRDAKDEVRQIPFNNLRPDVIQRALGTSPDGNPQLRCGFVAYLADVPGDFTLGVTLDGEVNWLCHVQLDGKQPAARAAPEPQPVQVIQGSADWLFLDNDTNRSVDQFTGRLTLDEGRLQRWQIYLEQTRALAREAGARHALVIAASKEQILPEYYPHARGPVTVHEQVLALCQPEHHVIDTAALLAAQSDRDACFIKTDTHWTDLAAMLVALAVLQELGLDAELARERLANDVYYLIPFSGDLGVKLTPPLNTPTEFLQSPPAAHGAVFDNAFPNIGRVLVFENSEPLWPLSLLIFGASSSYPMLKYLKRLFGRIVFVHSAGNVDAEIVRHERPDLLILQTTARFMIEPPNTAFSLRNAVVSKMLHVGEDVRARAAASVVQATSDARNLPYHQMLDLPT